MALLEELDEEMVGELGFGAGRGEAAEPGRDVLVEELFPAKILGECFLIAEAAEFAGSGYSRGGEDEFGRFHMTCRTRGGEGFVEQGAPFTGGVLLGEERSETLGERGWSGGLGLRDQQTGNDQLGCENNWRSRGHWLTRKDVDLATGT